MIPTRPALASWFAVPFLFLALLVPRAGSSREEGFVPLIRGPDLPGWVAHGDRSSWRLSEEGVLRNERSGGRGGGWLRFAEREYGDFLLRLSWRVSPGGNAGVFLRSAPGGGPARSGLEVQISNPPEDSLHSTGSLYGVAPVETEADAAAGEWHRFEIIAAGSRVRVLADGVEVVDADGRANRELEHRPPSGFLGLQASHQQGAGWIEYRDVRVRELSGEEVVAALEERVFHVSPEGDDAAADGSSDHPFATLARAVAEARRAREKKEISRVIELAAGVHFLAETVVLGPEDSGSIAAPLVIRSAPGARAILSGGVRLDLDWKEGPNSTFLAEVPAGLVFDQLFADGRRQPMARYPDFDPKVHHFNGWAADAISPERVKRWADPLGGYVHAMHRNLWGDFHWVIRGRRPDGSLELEGGWQNNRPSAMHPKYRMVENILEELDAPGEWFLDRKASRLHYRPAEGIDVRRARFVAVRLPALVELRGTAERPIRHVELRGLVFRHTSRTFMRNREPLLRSDWTIYRGGAVYLERAEECAVRGCEFDQVGGNAIFVSGHARGIEVRGCDIHGAGANGVAFVGSPAAVRSPLFRYDQRHRFSEIERTPGPKSEEYPRESRVEDCLIRRTGRFEKQTAGVQISMARGITVRHVSVYEVPRAGINISEGTFGGHVIEHCDVFDTVLETGDHGSFNSWGRDRYWHLVDLDLNDPEVWRERSRLPLLDVVEPITLRHNRWRCDHGWDIDLDDGSTNYRIADNLCLHGGIKLREGFYRVVENNITVGNTFHPHVWYRYSQDVFRRNIVFTPYRPIRVPKPWGREIDHNLLHRAGAEVAPARALAGASGRDEHSMTGDARFVAPDAGDYRVRADSPAVTTIGFRNFPMRRFGVVSPALRAIAREPELKAAGSPRSASGAE